MLKNTFTFTENTPFSKEGTLRGCARVLKSGIPLEKCARMNKVSECWVDISLKILLMLTIEINGEN